MTIKKHLKYMLVIFPFSHHLQLMTHAHLLETGGIIVSDGEIIVSDGASIVVLHTDLKLPGCSLDKESFTEFCKVHKIVEVIDLVPDIDEIFEKVPDQVTFIGKFNANIPYQIGKIVHEYSDALFTLAWMGEDDILFDVGLGTYIRVKNYLTPISQQVIHFDAVKLYKIARILSPDTLMVSVYRGVYEHEKFEAIYIEGDNPETGYAVLAEIQPINRKLERPSL